MYYVYRTEERKGDIIKLIFRKICVTSFACPSLGIKCDAYPGRLNQVSIFINREGVFYGLNNGQNCSEPVVKNHQIAGNT